MKDKKVNSCYLCGYNDRRVGIRKMGCSGYRVICAKCGAGGPYIRIANFSTKDEAQEAAIKAWNGEGELPV